MGFRIRKSIKLFPGVRLNFSPSGVSTTVGPRGASVNIGPRGVYQNIGLPGTGISYRAPLLGQPTSTKELPSQAPIPQPAFQKEISLPGVEQIKSESVEEITSLGLSEFKKLIAEASRQRTDLRLELTEIEPEVARTTHKRDKWDDGFLFRHIFKSKHQSIQNAAKEALQRQSELLADLEQSRVPLEFDANPEIYTTFNAAMDQFRALAACNYCWDITGQRATDKQAERTGASVSLSRTSVVLKCENSEILSTEYTAMKWQNANGHDLFIYPGFILMLNDVSNFALIDLREVRVEHNETKCIEPEFSPFDGEVVEQTWLKVNKDGSRDKRFADNRQIPVMKYGSISFSSAAGLREHYMFSSAKKAKNFFDAFVKHQSVLM